MSRACLVLGGALVLTLGRVGLFAQVVLPPPGYLPFTPLAGYLTQRYYQGAGCGEAALFYESIERIGVCGPWNNTAGEGEQPKGSMGSHIFYYCQDDYCHDPDPTVQSGCPTPTPTDPPTPTTKPTRSPTKRPPTALPMVAPSSLAPTPTPTSLAALVDAKTFVKTELKFPFSLNCTGNVDTTYWTVYACYKSGIVQSGQCDSSGTMFGKGTSIISTFTQGSQAPPPLLLKGQVSTIFPDAHNCSRGTNALYQSAYAGDRCIPTTNGSTQSGSVEYKNNHDWISINTYPGKADCAGKPASRQQLDVYSTCILDQRISTDAGMEYVSAFRSQAFTGPVPSYLARELQCALMWWQINTAVAALSSACSALMLVTLFRINKWTFFNLVLVPLAAWQLVFDLAVAASPYRDVVVQEAHVIHDAEAFLSFAAVDFFKEWAILNVFGITNLITLAVAYIFRFQRALQLGAFFPFVMAGIGCVSLALPLALCVLRVQTLRGYVEDASVVQTLLKAIGALKSASICFNSLVPAIALLMLQQEHTERGRGATVVSLPGDGQSGKTTTSVKSRTTMAAVLLHRLMPYPVIQLLTQLSSIVDFFYFKPRIVQNSTGGEQGNNTYTTDDAFYKTNGYIAIWFLQSFLVPSAGLLYFVSYMAFSPEARRVWIEYLVGAQLPSSSRGQRDRPTLVKDDARISAWDSNKVPPSQAAMAAQLESDSELDGAEPKLSEAEVRSKAWEAVLENQGFRANRALGPVFAALESDDEERLKVALQQPGVDLNAVGADGRSAALAAAEDGRLGCLKVLAAHGAELEGEGPSAASQGRTPAQGALSHRQLTCLEFLYARGVAAIEGVTMVHLYAALGKGELLEGLLSRGDASAVHARDAQGRTAAHWACEYQQAACLRVLFLHGADLRAVDSKGAAAVHVSAVCGSVDCLRFLHKAGADCDAKDGEGETAAYKALMRSQFDCFLCLEKRHAAIGDVDKCDDEGRSPCYLAAAAGNTAVLKLLVGKYDAAFLSKRTGLLSPEEKWIRTRIFAACAVVVAAGVGTLKSPGCMRVFDVVLTPYTLLLANVILFKLFQYFFEEALMPAYSFVRFYVGFRGVLGAAGELAQGGKITRPSAEPVGAGRRGSQLEMSSVYAQDVIPDKIVSNPLAAVGGFRISRTSLDVEAAGPADSFASDPGSLNTAATTTTTTTHLTAPHAETSRQGTGPWTFLLDRLDQNIVKQWRLKRYLSVSKVDPAYAGPDVWFQPSYLFLYLQITSALVSLVVAYAKIDSAATTWQQYETFYGLVVNAGLSTTTFSVLKMIFVDGRAQQISGLPLKYRFFIFLPCALLLPPLFTHILPAMICYFWMVLLLFAARQLVVTVRSDAYLSNPWLSFLSRKLRAYLLAFAAELITRLSFVFLVQTMYSYAAIFYAMPQPVGPPDYMAVIAFDLQLRSQTDCFLHNADSNEIRGVLLLLAFF